MYGPPSGRLILAREEDRFVGCVGIRALATDGAICEMKRLYVRDEGRGRGVGRRLAEAAIHAGRELGYTRMVLDTLERHDGGACAVCRARVPGNAARITAIPAPT